MCNKIIDLERLRTAYHGSSRYKHIRVVRTFIGPLLKPMAAQL